MAGEYLPVYAEEIFIVNLYGTDEELEEFNHLLKDVAEERNMYAMALIIEEIKRRNFLKMTWRCCWRCQYYITCKINWYRGERCVERRNCCTYCQNFWDCHKLYCEQEKVSSPGENPEEKTPDSNPPGSKPEERKE